jgi:hypothetical protein
MDDIQKLRAILREDDYPMFKDEELQMLLEESGSLKEAAYNGLVRKSENTQLNISGFTTNDTSSYFLRLAAMYRPTNTGILRD